jgi:hypothetical protein
MCDHSFYYLFGLFNTFTLDTTILKRNDCESVMSFEGRWSNANLKKNFHAPNLIP